MQVKQAGRASTGAGTGTDRRQRMGQAGSLATSQSCPRVQLGAARRGRATMALPSGPGVVSRFHLEVLHGPGPGDSTTSLRPVWPVQTAQAGLDATQYRSNPLWANLTLNLRRSFAPHSRVNPHIQCHTQWTLHCTRYFETTFGRWTKGWQIFGLGHLTRHFFS